MTAKVINGTEMANSVRAEIADCVAELTDRHGVTPGLAVVLAGDDPASMVYVRHKERAAIEARMISQIVTLKAEATEADVLAEIDRLNCDSGIHGILVQLPLSSHIDARTATEAVLPEKDVDGLHPYNKGLLLAGTPRFVPATPAGIQYMLVNSGFDPDGKHVVVCGRSDIVGKPIANLLMQRMPGANATVTVCHTRTKDLASITRQADILISAIKQPRFITADMVKDGVVVIDVGINRIPAPERKRGSRLVGDVDYESVSQKAAAITPVPGGVGPMTIAMLLRNVLEAACLTVEG